MTKTQKRRMQRIRTEQRRATEGSQQIVKDDKGKTKVTEHPKKMASLIIDDTIQETEKHVTETSGKGKQVISSTDESTDIDDLDNFMIWMMKSIIF